MKCFTSIIFSLFPYLMASAQVHQQGGAAADFSVARSGVGVIGGIGYTKDISDQAFFRLRGLAEFGRLYNFKYNQFAGDAMVYYCPVHISDFFQVNTGAGLSAGYEKVKGISKEKAATIGFQAGIKAGVEIEAFLGDQLSFFAFGNQAYMVKKSLGRNYYEIGIGMRVFLNNYY